MAKLIIEKTTDVCNLSIFGKALIVWEDPTKKKKMNCIDTDQITPSSYCISDSLEQIDTRWKEGTFRYLIPDFRKRVHRGETFLIVGDRFGIGSSREMSPAGLKGIAKEVNKDIVIVCGNGIGEIFRKNAINLGIPIVQSPLAVEDAQDDDEFCLDIGAGELLNITRSKKYKIVGISDQEKDLLNSGGIFAVGKKEYKSSLRQDATILWPDQTTGRNMTATEQILWAHLVNKEDPLVPGTTVKVWADLFPASDGTAPFAIYTFNQITEGSGYPKKAAIINDHFIYAKDRGQSDNQFLISKDFASKFGIQKPYFSEPGDGIFHFYLPEQGLIRPGGLYPGADSHSRAYGAFGSLGIGVGSTTVGFGWATGYIYLNNAKQRRVKLVGQLQPWVTGKDIVLALLKKWGDRQSQGMSVEFVDVNRQLPMYYRNTIANMMAEAEALNGIFPPDQITREWFQQRGFSTDYEDFQAGENAYFAIDEELDLSNILPMVSKPFSPANSGDIYSLARERITFDKAFIGSCTNGSYQDLLDAALVLQTARNRGLQKIHPQIALVVFPGSRLVKMQIEMSDVRLGGESVADIFRKIGGQIRESWCGPCFGQGPDALKEGERAITTFNRNWQHRMGKGGLGYLASPVVVAASALSGYICSPEELGIVWDFNKYRNY